MRAATAVLQPALQEAVQQLDPQLLALFDNSKSGIERSALPTQRVHAALKRLVALTRFFPEQHRVRKSGRQLEQIWPSLVHAPRGAVARKLLHYYFRVRHDLLDSPCKALHQAMQDLAHTGTAQGSASGMAGLECALRLKMLGTYLDGQPANAADSARLSPLAQLFLWQQHLEFVAVDGPPGQSISHQVLSPCRSVVLERCLALYRHSDWSLQYYCRSGLAQSLWHLRGLARFCGDEAGAALLAALEDSCLDMHLRHAPPTASAQQNWLVRLLALAQDEGVVHKRSVERVPACDPELHTLYETELAQYRSQLHSELAAGATLLISARLVTLLYKLTWLFDAVGRRHWALVCHSAYRVALQFRRLKRPVTRACLAVLEGLAHALGADGAEQPLRAWRQCLLQEWPNWAGDTQRQIALTGNTEQVVALAAVPGLLSASFATLVQILPGAGTLDGEGCRQLLQELTLLEKGAAAMKVWPLEQLCTLLINVYEFHLRDDTTLPAALLGPAHRQLVRMLDQSAAWREVQTDAALVQELDAWLVQQSTCREPGPGSPTQTGDSSEALLREQLLAYLGTLAAVLERPVRLQLDMANVVLAATQLRQVLDCLKPLVKFLLLDQSVDTRGRHAMHKPRVSTLAVTVRATSATLVLSAAEDSHEDVLAQAELHRLQRRLPKAAGALVCESRAGRGRCFTFTLHQPIAEQDS